MYKYAPWVRNIYIVTNGQIPSWLNLSHPKIHIVTHTAIFSNQTHLPTFASPSIESNIHRIPGLSDHFLYLNDDTMFGQPVYPEDFYTESKGQNVFLSWPVPSCAEDCSITWLGDGFCDAACNRKECNFDMGDCDKDPSRDGNEPVSCSIGCNHEWLGDGICNQECDNEACGKDGGDCNSDSLKVLLRGYDIEYNSSHLVIPDSNTSKSYYFDYSKVIGSNEIINSYHDNENVIHASILQHKLNTIIIIFRENVKRENVNIYLVSDKDHYEFSISVSTESYQMQPIPPKPTSDITEINPHVNTSSENNETLDTYGESLKHVDRLLSVKFGIEQRYVPSHMPFYLQKDVINRMHNLWKSEFEETSSNRFRSTRDMQFALSYFYFLMSERVTYNLNESIMHDIDINRDGVIQPQESRLLNALLLDKNTLFGLEDTNNYAIDKKDMDVEVQCSIHEPKYTIKDLKIQTLDDIINCTGLVEKLEAYYGAKRRNKFNVIDRSDDVGFVMINNSPSILKKKFDQILCLKYKFLCLNDNINYTDTVTDPKNAINELNAFFNLMYPEKSPFELEDGFGSYLYVQDLLANPNQDDSQKSSVPFIAPASVCVFLLCILVLYYKRSPPRNNISNSSIIH